MRFSILLLSLMLSSGLLYAQPTGIITGTVKDKNTQQLLPGVTISLTGADSLYTTTDLDGHFKVELRAGRYNLQASFVGFANYTTYNVNVTSGNPLVMQIEMEEQTQELDELVVTVGKSARATDMITPLATQKLTLEEIKVNPGGNFDVSKVIQVLPGVAGGTSPNRNDIIVRGGGPSENVYYLDGMEIPVLNHFQTQGASGGATGILNVSFIQDLQLTSSAFDSRYGNALASTIVIKQREGNPEKLSGNVRLSGSEFAAMLEGPMGKNTTYMVSARRSYLQFLFNLLDLPIRPDYWDFQYKVHHKIDKKTELTFIGVGAIDDFWLEAPDDSDAENEYILRANPLIKQWNYMMGASLKRLVDNGYYTLALSRNMFFNGADRYENNALKAGDKLYSLESHEIENKLRFDMNKFVDGWKFSYGADAQYVKYDAETFNTLQPAVVDSLGNVIAPPATRTDDTAIDFFRLGMYGQVAKYFLNDRLLLSGGVRTDGNTFTEGGLNPLKTISPRISAAYSFTDKWNISGSVGRYYKLPVYTMLGYRDEADELVNKGLEYTHATHYTVGTQFIPRNDLRITFEAFYKQYGNYPVSLTSGISYANIGTDFSAVGSDQYTSNGKGRVYGVEAYIQQKLVKNLFYVASATLYKSEFSGSDNRFVSSTWDYGYVFSTTVGYNFKRNWDVGVKYKIAGGQPYTPFDMEQSRAMYLTGGRGVYDYGRLNAARLPFYQGLDVRVDKKLNFDNVSLNLFVDFQNALMYKTASLPKYTFERNDDNSGFKTTDGLAIKSDGSNAIPVVLEQRSATIVPAVGFIFEF